MPQCDWIANIISLEAVPRVMTKQHAKDTRKHKLVSKLKEHVKVKVVPGVATGTLEGSDLKAGERGCAMAHRELWSHLRHRSGPTKTKTHLVLEDDASIKDSGKVCENLNRVAKRMEDQKIDMVNLGPCFWDKVRENGAPCTHAYMVSEEGLQKAYDHTDSYRGPIDHQIVDLCKRRKLKCDVEDIFAQADDVSYINSTTRPLKKYSDVTANPRMH